MVCCSTSECLLVNSTIQSADSAFKWMVPWTCGWINRLDRRLQTERLEADLADLIYQYGEERFSRRIARAIVRSRRERSLMTTRESGCVIQDAVPSAYRRGRIHCATRTFQALRIAVNREIETLEPALRGAVEVLRPGGRIAVISFQLAGDRIVKQQRFRPPSKGKMRSSRS